MPHPSASRPPLFDRLAHGVARLLLAVSCMAATAAAHADKITVAAAADLKFAMDELVAQFTKVNPGDEVVVVYGSSGKFFAQIQQGAPFDMFFSADISYPQELAKAGLAASEVRPYAVGRLALWSTSLDATKLTLASLADPKITRIAIANPKHAPYGKRAEEALRAAGLWDKVEPKLVFGENIAATAQYVQTGNAQVGLISQSLAISPELARQGGHSLIDDKLHSPLLQGYIVTQRGAAQAPALTQRLADHLASRPGRALLARYGFAWPGDAGTR